MQVESQQSGLWNTLPTLGTAAGLIGGFAYRHWQQIPADFKVLDPLNAIPFRSPMLNGINGAMQTMIKGPMKYIVPALPLFSIGLGVASRTWKNRNASVNAVFPLEDLKPQGLWASFKQQVKILPKGELVQATTLVALAVLMAITQTQWLPAVTQLLPVGADPSSHALMQIALGWGQALCLQAEAKAGYSKNTNRFFHALSASLGAANAIFMFNTSTTFHTVKEMMSSSMLTLGAIGVSAYVSKGLPRISEITTVTSGASMIAAAMGYDTTAFNSLVLAPITFAYMAMIPSAIYDFNKHWNPKLAIPLTVLGVLGRPFANPALTVLTSRSGYTGLIKAGTTFTTMMSIWANTSVVQLLGIELKRPSNVRTLNRNRIPMFSWALVAGLTQVGALCAGRPLISGTLCMTSVASQLISEHYTRNQRRAWLEQQALKNQSCAESS